MNALTSYFQGVIVELRNVVWPSFPTLVRHFLSVVVGISVATACIAGLDVVFLKLLALIIK